MHQSTIAGPRRWSGTLPAGWQSSARGALRLEMPAVARHGEAEGEIDQGYEDVDLDAEALPGRIDDGRLRGREQVEDADDQDEAGVLEEGDEGVHQRRNPVAAR